MPTVYTVRTSDQDPATRAWAYVEPPVEDLVGTGRLDPAALAVLFGDAPLVPGADPPPASRRELALLDAVHRAHLDLYFDQPGRAAAVEAGWAAGLDTLVAGTPRAAAPEDLRAYAAVISGSRRRSAPTGTWRATSPACTPRRAATRAPARKGTRPT